MENNKMYTKLYRSSLELDQNYMYMYVEKSDNQYLIGLSQHVYNLEIEKYLCEKRFIS